MIPVTLWRRPRSRRLLELPLDLLRDKTWARFELMVDVDRVEVRVNGVPMMNVPGSRRPLWIRFYLKGHADPKETEARAREWLYERFPKEPRMPAVGDPYTLNFNADLFGDSSF